MVTQTADKVESTPEPQVTQNLLWMCEKCGKTTEGTAGKFLNFCQKHSKSNGCSVILVNDSHEKLATSLTDARHKGLIEKAPKQGKHTGDKSGDVGGTGMPKDGQPLFTGYFKTEKVELDSRLFLYRDLFAQENLIPAGTTMGAFLLGTVEALLEITGRKIAIVANR